MIADSLHYRDRPAVPDAEAFARNSGDVRFAGGRAEVARGLAVLANPKNVRDLEHQKAIAQAKAAKLKASAQAVAKRLADTPVTLKRKVGEQDKLYGSVTAMDVAEALAARGLQIDRRSIDLAEPIKTTGDFEVPVKLHSEVVGKAKVKVEAE